MERRGGIRTLGWTISDAAKVRDNMRRELDLGLGSPALVKHVVAKRVRQQLEERLTSKLIERGKLQGGRKIDWGPLRSYFRRENDKEDKKRVMQAIWGCKKTYLIISIEAASQWPPLCLCREPDTIQHKRSCFIHEGAMEKSIFFGGSTPLEEIVTIMMADDIPDERTDVGRIRVHDGGADITGRTAHGPHRRRHLH